jgi:O-antigen/teichoic acid export membrane protein
MGRRIITSQLEAKGESAKLDGYFDKLLKYIPTEIVGAWIAITGLIKSASNIPTNTILWILLVIFTGLTALYILRQTYELKKPPAVKQTIISTIAFIIWVFALGKPFDSLSFYSPVYGSIVLIIYNLIIPLINPVEDDKN